MIRLGAARSGDVVFFRATDDMHASIAKAIQGTSDALFEEPGVRLVVMHRALEPVGFLPRHAVKAKKGPTPRWAR